MGFGVCGLGSAASSSLRRVWGLGSETLNPEILNQETVRVYGLGLPVLRRFSTTIEAPAVAVHTRNFPDLAGWAKEALSFRV